MFVTILHALICLFGMTRQELLRETKEINAKMMTIVSESGHNPADFLPTVPWHQAPTHREAYATMMLFFLRVHSPLENPTRKLAKECTKCIKVLMFPDSTRLSPFNIVFLHFSTGHVTEGRVPFLPPLENLCQERRAGASFIECFGKWNATNFTSILTSYWPVRRNLQWQKKLGEAVVGV